MDKSKKASFIVAMTFIYNALGIISIACESVYQDLYKTNRDLAMNFYDVGSSISPFVLLILPLILVPVFLIVSLSGIIKSRKALPYLLCPPVSVIIWFVTFAVYTRYV